mgnify:CR=1 FL=1
MGKTGVTTGKWPSQPFCWGLYSWRHSPFPLVEHLARSTIPYWDEETSPDPSGEGATLWIEVDREENGSGKVSYTVDNLSTLARLQATTGGEQWVDFSQGGTFHRVTESLSRDEARRHWMWGTPGRSLRSFPRRPWPCRGATAFVWRAWGRCLYRQSQRTVEAENGEPVHSSMGTGGLMVAMDTEDLMEGSHLVAVCRLKEVSRPFRIRSAGSEGNGGLQNYTDYYLKCWRPCEARRRVLSSPCGAWGAG